MNRIYRSIWNEKTGTVVAASEHARSTGGHNSAGTKLGGVATHVLRLLLMLPLLLPFAPNTYALPVGGVVTAGGASIGRGENSNTITQSSQNVAINWQSFNIGQNESVRFMQPNSHSIALNRVLGPDPSSILGSLSANGKVFLINPNGILFGSGAQVNVGGLVASTLNISDIDFMAGRFRFSGHSIATVSNQGTINADGGYVALLGAKVSNEGVIQARLGTIALAAGQAMTLDMAGDGLLNVAINQGAINALAENGGLLQANGGQVLMTAQAAESLLPSAVNTRGIIQAQSIENKNGTIRLLGDMQGGTVNVSGTLDVSAPGSGKVGGGVTATGHHVGLIDARIDASGDAGGGSVLIGGDYQGRNPLVQNAARTYIGPDTVVRADAITQGDGGKVIVWADDIAQFQGNISARGGAQFGNGGFAEVSGKNGLVFGGYVDLRAPGGRTGTLLLDPLNITIQAAAPDIVGNATGLDLNSAVNTPNIFFADYAGSNSIITTGQVVTQLNTANVTLQATNDITVAAAIDASSNVAGKALTLQAGHDVIINAALTASSAGGGSFILNAGRNVTVGAAITASNGSVTLSAGNNGTGPGAAAGTVTFTAVTAANLSIRFNPVAYTTTGAEIAAYAPKATLTGTFDARAWTFINNASATAQSKTYDGTTVATLNNPFAFLSGPDGATAGQIVSLSAGSANFNSAHVATATTVGFAGYGLVGADSSMYALFAQPANQLKTITAAPLTVTAANGSRVYGEANPALTGNISGFKNGETATDLTAAPSYSTPATLASNVGNYAIVGAGGTATNYSFSYVNGSLAVTQRPLTVAADAKTKTYGSLDPALTYAIGATAAGTGLVNGDTLGGSLIRVAGESVAAGPYAIQQGTLTASGNYSVAFTGALLTLNPLALVGSLTAGSSLYGAALAPGVASFSNIVGADQVTPAAVLVDTTGLLSSSGNLRAGNHVGIESVSAVLGGADAANYSFTGLAANYTVSPLNTDIRGSRIYDGSVTANGTAMPTITALIAGDTVSVLGSGAVATKDVGNNKAITDIGSLALGGGDAGNYTLIDGTLTITQAALTITADNKNKVYGALDPMLSASYSGFQPGDDSNVVTGMSLATASGAAATSGSHTIALSGASAANYAITEIDGTLTVSRAALTITADDKAKVYGAADPVLTASYGAFQYGDTPAVVTGLNLTTSTGAAATAGSHAIDASGASATNYAITEIDGTLTVSRAALTITADDKSKVYGAVDPVLTVSYGPFQYGDTPAVVSGLGLATATGTAANAGTHVIDASGASTLNYSVIEVDGTLTVTPLALIGSITAADKTYDATNSAIITGRSLAGVVGTDVVTYSGGTAVFDTPLVGIGKPVTASALGLSGPDASNYTVNSTAATTATITPDITPPAVPPVIPPVIPPVVLPPIDPPPVAPEPTPAPPEQPAAEEKLGTEEHLTPAASLQDSPNVMPRLVRTRLPPQLQSLAASVVPIVTAAVLPLPLAILDELPPPIYIPPLRPRKHDRN